MAIMHMHGQTVCCIEKVVELRKASGQGALNLQQKRVRTQQFSEAHNLAFRPHSSSVTIRMNGGRSLGRARNDAQAHQHGCRVSKGVG